MIQRGISQETLRAIAPASRMADAPRPGAVAWSTKPGKAKRSAPTESEHRRKVREDFARRHPERAKEERGFRVANDRIAKRWDHKANGTAQTHEHFSRVSEGAIARLHATGAIDGEQLAAAIEIRAAAEAVRRGVTVRTASLETRIDRGGAREAVFHEAIGAVWAEMAYSRWRSEVASAAAMIDLIVEDAGVTIVAKRHRMGVKRARKLLIDALNLWWRLHAEVRREVDRATLAAAHEGIL